jgi:hypothetical protein
MFANLQQEPSHTARRTLFSRRSQEAQGSLKSLIGAGRFGRDNILASPQGASRQGFSGVTLQGCRRDDASGPEECHDLASPVAPEPNGPDRAVDHFDSVGQELVLPEKNDIAGDEPEPRISGRRPNQALRSQDARKIRVPRVVKR